MEPLYPKKFCTICGKCFEEADYRPFRKGFHPWCRSCQKTKQAISQSAYRQRHPERVQAYKAKPEVKQHHNSYRQQRRLDHPELYISENERQKAKHNQQRRDAGKVEKPVLPPELRKGRRAYTKAMWQKNHPESGVETSARRYAQTHHTAYNPVDYDRIRQQSNGVCYICLKPLLPDQELEYDHVIPLARHGTHTEDNIRLTHGVCNRRKNAKFLENMSDYDRRGPG